MNARYATAIVGFGRIASGYSADAAMKRAFRYASHSEVLVEHPRFDWRAVVDPWGDARRSARERWSIADVAATPAELANAGGIEVVVLATPPTERLALLDAFPDLRLVIVEKPLATTLAGARAFADACAARNIAVQVNVTRRADRTVRALSAGGLVERIGRVQAVNVVYGNGLANHGPHMVDLVRMLAGEILAVRADPDSRTHRSDGPIPGDRNIPFVARTTDAIPVAFTPVDFAHYREVDVDLWGERGRLDYRHGGLVVHHYARVAGKAPANTFEIEALPSLALPPTLGEALYAMYDNAAAVLDGTATLVSPPYEALRTASIIDAVTRSAQNGGQEIACGPDDGVLA